ncbi:MAG: TauD/TfdA family dioxygenase [Mycobacterium sp.]
MPITINAVTPTVGLEIIGMTADQLVEPQAASDAQRALDQHGVVVYREINISDEQLLAFSRLLGKLVVQPTGEHRYPEIQTITLDPAKTNALLASYRQGNFHWHIDGAIDEYPQKATLLTARAVDPAGGDTEFANTYAAYAGLTDDERAEIADLRVVHSFARAVAGQPRRDRGPTPVVGPRPRPSASAGLDSRQWTPVAAARCHRSRDRRLARHQGASLTGPASGLVDTTSVHAASHVARR